MNIKVQNFPLFFVLFHLALSRPSVNRRNDEHGNYGYEYGVSHPSGSSRVHVKAGGVNRIAQESHYYPRHTAPEVQSQYETYPAASYPSSYPHNSASSDIPRSHVKEDLPVYKEPGYVLGAEKIPVPVDELPRDGYQSSYPLSADEVPSKYNLPANHYAQNPYDREDNSYNPSNKPLKYNPSPVQGPVDVEFHPDTFHKSNNDFEADSGVIPEQELVDVDFHSNPERVVKEIDASQEVPAQILAQGPVDVDFHPNSEIVGKTIQKVPVEVPVDVEFHKDTQITDENNDGFQEAPVQYPSYPPFPTDAVGHPEDKSSVQFQDNNQDDTPIQAPTSAAQVAGHIHVPSLSYDTPSEHHVSDAVSGRKTKPKYVFVPSGPPYTSVSHATQILHAAPRSSVPVSHEIPPYSPAHVKGATPSPAAAHPEAPFSSHGENSHLVLNSPEQPLVSHSIPLPASTVKGSVNAESNSFQPAPVPHSIKLPESAFSSNKEVSGPTTENEAFPEFPLSEPGNSPKTPLSHSILLPVGVSSNKGSQPIETGPALLPEAEALRSVPGDLPHAPFSHSIRLYPEIPKSQSLSSLEDGGEPSLPFSKETSHSPVSHSIRLPLTAPKNLEPDVLTPVEESAPYVPPISHSIRLNPFNSKPETLPNASFLSYNEPIAVETSPVSPISHALRIPLPTRNHNDKFA